MKGISTFSLKWIAVITMIVDHVGLVLFPQHLFWRVIGRLSFPIFAYLLTEGFRHTRDVKKYLIRLGIFALVSEVPYDLMMSGKVFDLQNQNIYFTLFFGLLMLALYSRTCEYWKQVGIVVVIGLICVLLHTDYSAIGIMLIWVFYYMNGKKVWQALIVVILMASSGRIQALGSLALIPIFLHNKTQGPKWKYVFYWIYPIHMMVLYLMS